MSGDTFNFSSSNFSFSNFNYDNFDSSDSSNNCYIDDNGDLHEVSDTKDSYDNTMKNNEYKHYTGTSLFGEDYSDTDYEGWEG